VSLKLADRDLDVMLKDLNNLMKTVDGDMFMLEKEVGYGWKLHRQTSDGKIELISPNYYITKNMMWDLLVNLLMGIRLHTNQIEKQTEVTA
jgi:hypothetical protein